MTETSPISHFPGTGLFSKNPWTPESLFSKILWTPERFQNLQFSNQMENHFGVWLFETTVQRRQNIDSLVQSRMPNHITPVMPGKLAPAPSRERRSKICGSFKRNIQSLYSSDYNAANTSLWLRKSESANRREGKIRQSCTLNATRTELSMKKLQACARGGHYSLTCYSSGYPNSNSEYGRITAANQFINFLQSDKVT